MDTYRAELAYNRLGGVPDYRIFRHGGAPPRIQPYDMKIPDTFLPWDDRGGVIAFPKTERPQKLCRCGVVEKVDFFQLGQEGSICVGLKAMDKNQLKVQRDDVDNEIRVMAQLQTAGLTSARGNPHFLLWEYGADRYNEYVATEFAVKGSLCVYARKKIKDLVSYSGRKFSHIQNMDLRKDSARKYVGCTWMEEGMRLFCHVINGVAFMHGQNVCHLDIDPNNLVIDSEGILKIIDFGSSVVMDHRGFAGTGSTLVKFKPLFVAGEVKQNNRSPAPRRGFNGAAADMWSIGVLLYQLLVWGYPAGHMALTHDSKWSYNVLQHVNGAHPKPGEGCYLCYRKILFPDFILQIFGGLLKRDSNSRWTAIDVANILKQPMAELLTFQQLRGLQEAQARGQDLTKQGIGEQRQTVQQAAFG